MHLRKSSSINNAVKGQKEGCQIGVFVLNFSIYHIPRAEFVLIGGESFRGHPGSRKCGRLHVETQNSMFLQLLSYQLSGGAGVVHLGRGTARLSLFPSHRNYRTSEQS